MAADFDKTMRVQRLEATPTRVLPQQFAPVQTRRWPFVLIVVLAVVACATMVKMVHRGERSEQAEQLLRLLGR